MSAVDHGSPAQHREQPQKVTLEQIAAVQNMIEKCMQLYMGQEEVVACLKAQANIEPNFTQLVWQKLEEQNADFFRAYNLHVKVKGQVVLFNSLLEQQVHMLQKVPGGHAQQQAQSSSARQPTGIPAMQPGGAGAALPAASVPAAALPLHRAASDAGKQQPAQAQLQQQATMTSMPMTQQEQEQFQQQFNQHLQQHVQQHLQQTLQHQQQQLAPNAWPLRFEPQAALPLQALGGLPGMPYPFMPDPAALAAAAAAAAAAARRAAPAIQPAVPTGSNSTAGTGGNTPMAASSSKGFAGSTTDMLAAWGLGSSMQPVAQRAGHSTGEADRAASLPPSPAEHGSEQQQQQQQQHMQQQQLMQQQIQQQVQQQQQMAAINAAASVAAVQHMQSAATAPALSTGGARGAAVVGNTAGAAAAVRVAATNTQSMPPVSSGSYLPTVSSCAMLDSVEQLPPLAKSFSLSDLDALDMPNQLTGELGDFSGLGEAEAAVEGTGAGPEGAGAGQAGQQVGLTLADLDMMSADMLK